MRWSISSGRSGQWLRPRADLELAWLASWHRRPPGGAHWPGGTRVAQVRQVHGVEFIEARRAGMEVEADGILLSRGEIGLIRTADCVPLFIWNRSRAVLVHAGWRGLAQGIAALAVLRLRRSAPPGEEPCVMIGPHIRACCYEVDEYLAGAFVERFGPSVVGAGTGRPHLSLTRATIVDLLRAGLRPTNVLDGGICTHCSDLRLPSHRRSAGAPDRLFTVAGIGLDPHAAGRSGLLPDGLPAA